MTLTSSMCLLCRRKISFLPSRRRAASGLLAASFVGLGTYDDQLSKKGEKASKLDPELERRTSRFDRPIQEGEVDFEAAYADRSNQDWRMKMKMMWRYDDHGFPSPELKFVQDATFLSGFVGVVWGGYLRSREARLRFIEENKHEMFKHPYEAQRSMVDRMMLGFGRGGFSLGWRMALLTFIFTSVSTSMTAIRNKVNPVDHLVAGATMGVLWRLQGGPRGMAVGGAVGSTLGLAAGCAYWVQEFASGETVTEKWNRELQRQERVNREREEKMRKQQEERMPRYANWTAEAGKEEQKDEPHPITKRIRKFMTS